MIRDKQKAKNFILAFCFLDLSGPEISLHIKMLILLNLNYHLKCNTMLLP